jgi:Domain of unknown function (DUF4249)
MNLSRKSKRSISDRSVPILRFCVLAFAVTNFSCEDVIDPSLSKSAPLVNVDAWLTDKPEPQIIQVTWTVNYDDNANLPPAVSGCIVTVTDDLGREYVFIENDQNADGRYIWTPGAADDVLGGVGRSFTLRVQLPADTPENSRYSNQIVTATSFMNAAPMIEDITYEFEEGSALNGDNDGYRAEFKGADLPGIGNTYWIRTYKNGVYLNKPSEINIAYDAGTTRDSGFDGVSFIPPIRLGINPNEVDENDDPLPPYELNDTIYIEIHSITEAAFNYLNEVSSSTDRQTGIGSIFSSTPLANTSTNLTSSGAKVVGFFNTSSVSGKGITIR